MVKRSVNGYRPFNISAANPGRRFADKSLVAGVIEALAPLPQRRFEHTLFTSKGKVVRRQLTARASLILALEGAAAGYQIAQNERAKPSALQLAKEFEAIERAAKRLLGALHAGLDGDVDEVPYALLIGGLQAWANVEHGGHALSKAPIFLPGESVAATRVEAAIRGVAALRLWANAARDRKQRTHLQKREGVAPAYDGNAALNEYLTRVLADCWWGICAREITDSPKPIAFCKAAAKLVGVKLSEDAARERLRRGLQRRGKSKAI